MFNTMFNMKNFFVFLVVILIQFLSTKTENQGKFSDHLSFVLYTSSWLDYVLINASTPEKLLEQPNFDSSKKTVFFVPGAPTRLDSPIICGIIDSYINADTYNVITLHHLYYTHDRNTSPNFIMLIGEAFGESITKLLSYGLPVENIELVGHSLGAHIIPVIANYTTPKLPLSIGLDPAVIGGLFNKGYTTFTIGLWTNSGGIGELEWKADVNLIANDGITQPYCKDLAGVMFYIRCNHLIALDYWGFMITNPDLFYGISCNETICNQEDIVQLGPNLRNKGTYYFRTSNTEPFGLGLEGVQNFQPAKNESRYNYRKIFFAIYYH